MKNNSGCIEISFKSFNHRYGKDIETFKIYHYSDIASRISHTQSKSKLDKMPELPQLRHLTEPILYSKVRKIKIADNISYSEEIAGSVKTVYSSSDNDERIDAFMNEDDMVQKVSLFLSEISIFSGSNKNMLNSSIHNHTHSLLINNNDAFESELSIKNKKNISNKEKKNASSLNLRSMSVQKQIMWALSNAISFK